VIGTIHLLNKNQSEARDYLLKAQAIFEQKGLLKLLKEVKQKLKLIGPNGKFNQMMSDGQINAAQMLGVGTNAAGIADSDDDGLGDVASPEQVVARKGSKGPAKKGKKKYSGSGMSGVAG